MKEQLLKLGAKVDALTLRERGLLFAAATALVLFVLYLTQLQPKLQRQGILQAELSQQANHVAGIDAEIARMAQGFVADPDAATRARLEQLRNQMQTSSAALMAVQKGLVAPQKIVPLLEQLLRANGKLKLVSLRSLPVSGMSEAVVQASGQGGQPQPAAAVPVAAPTPTPTPGMAAGPAQAPVKPRELLYRHGVEIVVQGGYLDMVNYMEALEALPVQLFWGQAQLDAGHYPNARLTLTLYTLSLDQKWMTL